MGELTDIIKNQFLILLNDLKEGNYDNVCRKDFFAKFREDCLDRYQKFVWRFGTDVEIEYEASHDFMELLEELREKFLLEFENDAQLDIEQKQDLELEKITAAE